MTLRMTRRLFVASAAAATLAKSATAQDAAAPEKEEMAAGEAKEIVIEMLNKDPENPKNRMIFTPRVTVLQPGDTVKWVPTDRGHNSAIIDDMIPADVEGWDGKINEEIAVTFEKPGFYGYKCTPHASVGMVGLIIVEGEGMMDNLEAAKGVRHRGKSAKIWEEIWSEVDAMEFTGA